MEISWIDVHYSTVYKIFRKWSSFNVFKIAHETIINKIYNNGNSELLCNMYLDSTDILNKFAYESVDYTFKYLNKKATRVSIWSEELYDIPLTNNIAAPYMHDSSLTTDVIRSLPFKLKNMKRKPKNLIADGGYINEKTKKINSRLNYI